MPTHPKGGGNFMTWQDLIPSVHTVLTGALSIALGVGGTVGVQSVRTPDAPKAPTKTEVACVAPAEVGKLTDRMAGMETMGATVLEEMRLLRIEQDRRARVRAAREAAKASEADGFKIFGVLIK